jgi:sialate O-acetylesterase
MGPFYTGMSVNGNSVILDFKYTGSGLSSRDGKDLNGFEIAGSDGKFVTAVALIKNNQVIVSSPQIQQPVSVRYAWSEAAHTNFYNLDELPVMSFRTDNPLVEKFK